MEHHPSALLSGALLLVASASASSVLGSYPFKPWLGNLFEFQLKGSYTFQHFSHIRADAVTLRQSTNSSLVDFDLGMTVLPVISAGFDFGFQQHTAHAMTFDYMRLRLQYLLFDDIIGDAVSMTINTSLISVDRKAVPTLGLMHNGRFGGLLGVSIGREWAIGRIFTHRLWANIGLGAASHASLYTSDSLSWQINFIDRIRLGMNGYFDGGLGTDRFDKLDTYSGLRHLRYRTAGVSLDLKYRWGIWGDLTLSAGRRLWAENAPEDNLFVRVSYHLPFAAF
jgi:hypothetical protein